MHGMICNSLRSGGWLSTSLIFTTSCSGSKQTAVAVSPQVAAMGTVVSKIFTQVDCNHSINDGYNLGPLNDISLLRYNLVVPSPSQTLPTFTSHDYVKLIAFNGNPSARSDYDLPTREQCVELFQSIHNLYPNSTVLGPSANAFNFRFSHGDLHDGNILVDPQSGAITGTVDFHCGPRSAVLGGLRRIGSDSYLALSALETSPTTLALRTQSYEHFSHRVV